MIRELLKSPAPWVLGLLIALTTGAVLISNSAPWWGETLWGQEMIGSSLIFTLPLISAFAAWWAVRRGEPLGNLLTDPRATRRHTLATIVTLWMPAALAILLAHAVVVAVTPFAPLQIMNGSWWPVIVQALSPAAAVALGFVCGARFRSYVALVVAASAWAGVLAAQRAGAFGDILLDSTAASASLGAEPDPGAYAWRVLLIAIIVGLLICALLTTRIRRKLLIAGGVVAVFITAAALDLGADNKFRASPEDQTRCAGEEVTVCGPRDLQERIDEALVPIEGATDELVDLGVTPIRRFVVWTGYAHLMDDPWVEIYNPGRIRDDLNRTTVIEGVVAPSSCGLWTGNEPPPRRWFTAEGVVAAYVSENLGITAQPQNVDALQQLRDQRGDAALADIAGAAQALNRCDLNLVPDALSAVEYP